MLDSQKTDVLLERLEALSNTQTLSFAHIQSTVRDIKSEIEGLRGTVTALDARLREVEKDTIRTSAKLAGIGIVISSLVALVIARFAS